MVKSHFARVSLIAAAILLFLTVLVGNVEAQSVATATALPAGVAAALRSGAEGLVANAEAQLKLPVPRLDVRDLTYAAHCSFALGQDPARGEARRQRARSHRTQCASTARRCKKLRQAAFRQAAL